MQVEQYQKEVNEILRHLNLTLKSLIRDRDAATGALKTKLRYVGERIEDARNEISRASDELAWVKDGELS